MTMRLRLLIAAILLSITAIQSSADRKWPWLSESARKEVIKKVKSLGYKTKDFYTKYILVKDKNGKVGIFDYSGKQRLACVGKDWEDVCYAEIFEYSDACSVDLFNIRSERRVVKGDGSTLLAPGHALKPWEVIAKPVKDTPNSEVYDRYYPDVLVKIVTTDDTGSPTGMTGAVDLNGNIVIPCKYSDVFLAFSDDRSLYFAQESTASNMADVYSPKGELLTKLPIYIEFLGSLDTDHGKITFIGDTRAHKYAVVDQDFRIILPWNEKNYSFIKTDDSRIWLCTAIGFPKTGVSPSNLLGVTAIYDLYGNPLYTEQDRDAEPKFLSSGYLLVLNYGDNSRLYSPTGDVVLTAKSLYLEKNGFSYKHNGRSDWFRDEYIYVLPHEGDSYYCTTRGERVDLNTAAGRKLATEHARPDNSGSTLIAKGNKVATKQLPMLELVDGSIAFVDPSGNNAIEADGSYTIRYSVRNAGTGTGVNCQPVVKTGAPGVSVANPKPFNIAPGETKELTATVTASGSTTDGVAEFSIAVDEANGFGTDAKALSVNTHAFVAPMVVVNDYTLTGSSNATTLQRKVPFDLQILIQNIQHGRADNVNVTLSLPDNVYIVEGDPSTDIATLDGGDTKSLVYTLVANNRYTADVIPVNVKVTEKHGRYAQGRTIDLNISQPLASAKISVSETRRQPGEINIATLTSAVDRNIPAASAQAPNTFAVIIANEQYTDVAPVPHALNDGHIFAEYCRTTLGIPASNVREVSNATRNDMLRQLNWLGEIGNAYGADANIIFYYSGHGVPSETDRQSYLIPVDGYHSDMATNLSLDEIYRRLGNLGAGRVLVLLDACFSGTERGDGMLYAARGVRLKAKSGIPVGSMVVMTAAQGDETAYPLDSESHGMFTYYLLKKLQESGGNVTLGELSDYVTTEVSRRSVVANSKPQTPAVLVSPAIGESWRNIKLNH